MTILLFFAVLVVLILVHELGHFLVAKLFGIRVDEFGIGFPPKIWGKKYGETEYTLNWLPIGGFVRIWGEDPTEEHYEDGAGSERSFVKKPRYAQALVLVAGVSMNVLLAFVLYVTAGMMGTPTVVAEGEVNPEVQNARLLVTSVVPQSPAEVSLKPGDEILKVARGETTLSAEEMRSPKAISVFVGAEADTPVVLTVARRGESVEAVVVPRTGVVAEDADRVAAGFSMSFVGMQKLSFLDAVRDGATRTYQGLIDVVMGLYMMIKGEVNLAQVTGPIGIVGMVGDAAALGTVWLMTFTAFISLNLAVINLLPIPALDGGRLVFVGIEAVTRKPISPTIAVRVNQIGFIFLLGLMALVTVSDVVKLF